MENFRDINRKILSCRRNNDLSGAISLCQDAIHKFPKNNFYYKILGDLFLLNQDFTASLDNYLIHLTYIDDRLELFKGFVKYYERLCQMDSTQRDSHNKTIQNAISSNRFSLNVTDWLTEYLYPNSKEQNAQKHEPYIDSDRYYNQFTKKIQELEKTQNNTELLHLLQLCINRTDRRNTKRIDDFAISVLERHHKYYDALKICRELMPTVSNPVLVRSLMRICRTIKDYSTAEELMKTNPAIFQRDDFNIQYEMFFYYKELNDEQALLTCLNKINRAAQSSLPIARTLYNLYLQAGMTEAARSQQKHIERLSDAAAITGNNLLKYSAQEESSLALADTINQLITEQEHTRQMTAIKELLKGFTHEVGQPITNIRYAIQLYEMKSEMNALKAEDITHVMEVVIRQTERWGRLLNRFSPMFSQKNSEINFSVMERFRSVAEDMRMKLEDIECICQGDDGILKGDPVKFDQIIYNLINNSIHAIHSLRNTGEILVSVAETKNHVTIRFSDNGIGIPPRLQREIFKPFFSTKDISKDDGGEGLGLYIVWNLVKMFNGSISIDSSQTQGAVFLIKFKKIQEGI